MVGAHLEFYAIILALLPYYMGKFLRKGRSPSWDIAWRHPEASARLINAFTHKISTTVYNELLKARVLCHHRGQHFAGLCADDVSYRKWRLLGFLDIN